MGFLETRIVEIYAVQTAEIVFSYKLCQSEFMGAN